MLPNAIAQASRSRSRRQGNPKQFCDNHRDPPQGKRAESASFGSDLR
jgi:hypothetical protein